MDVAGEARFEFGRIVGRTFALFGRNAVPFLILSILFVGAPQFAYFWVQDYIAQTNPSMALTIGLGEVVLTLVTALFLQGALTRASIDDLSGKGVRLGTALGDGFRFVLPLFAMGILLGLGLMVGFILLVIPGIILAVRWAAAGPAVVVERLGPTSALGRSSELTSGHRWAIFGLGLLYFAALYGCQFALELAIRSGGLAAGAQGDLVTFQPVAVGFAAASSLLQVILTIVSTLGAASLYFELRRVKDGVDVDELGKVFE